MSAHDDLLAAFRPLAEFQTEQLTLPKVCRHEKVRASTVSGDSYAYECGDCGSSFSASGRLYYVLAQKAIAEGLSAPTFLDVALGHGGVVVRTVLE